MLESMRRDAAAIDIQRVWRGRAGRGDARRLLVERKLGTFGGAIVGLCIVYGLMILSSSSTTLSPFLTPMLHCVHGLGR